MVATPPPLEVMVGWQVEVAASALDSPIAGFGTDPELGRDASLTRADEGLAEEELEMAPVGSSPGPACRWSRAA